MQISEISDKTQWNSHIGSLQKSQFLQSYEWGEFQKSMGRKVWRLGTEQDGKLIDTAQVIKHDLPLGKSYLYMPRVVMSHEESVIRELEKIAKQENSIFLKIEPVNQLSIINLPAGRQGYQLSIAKPIQPQTTLYLDLTHSEQEILSSLRQKTRYNIRLAEKRGVTVKESNNINEFFKLNRETSKRDKFKSHPDKYYQKMYNILGNYQLSIINYQCRLKLFTAYYKDKPLSTNIVILFGDTATYTHGASSNENRNIMAPYLLQWEIIKYAKSQNYKWYDFWGINPSDKNLSNLKARFANLAFRETWFNPSWQGITRFKRGFVSEKTGQEITYPNCYDLIFQPKWYKLYKIAKYFKI
ncbi:peptidoglycan bridge formation glycyltransferase FemA/FemB family protein [Candidatus Parcubacteria bacterium]|nr:peptidoglycan bridge formation glycyltransferase FemA/FemB family protein [Patescibacteria group bacterium]MCG2693393.1 peptidoglycan bridge formation glycyltransferase FemA/FemB family protein [Candidatus Parcubacteria bacterium]